MFCFLSALPLCLWGVTLEYGSVSRFWGVFSVVYGFCVGLCCLGGLRGLCGFCVREWLGGFGTCCVFAPHFISFASLLLLLSRFLLSWLVLLSSLFVLLHCLCWLFGCGCCFLFPYGYTDKKKGRAVLVRPLLS